MHRGKWHLVIAIFVANSASQSLDRQQIDGPCDPSVNQSECGSNAICGTTLPGACQRGICICESADFAPLYKNATDCGIVLLPGDTCSTSGDDASLIPDYAFCNKIGIIGCKYDLTAVNKTCVAPPNVKGAPGDVCDDNVKCNEALLLQCSRLNERGRRCQCQNNLIFKDGRCQPALYGDPCSNDDQCNVVYNELPGASRGMCSNGTCVCGDQYIKVDSIIRSSPSSQKQRDSAPSIVVGYYCHTSLMEARMTAALYEECSVPLPLETFDPTKTFCEPGLVCMHCSEDDSAWLGTCRNVTVLASMSGVVTQGFMRPTTLPPTTTTTSTTTTASTVRSATIVLSSELIGEAITFRPTTTVTASRPSGTSTAAKHGSHYSTLGEASTTPSTNGNTKKVVNSSTRVYPASASLSIIFLFFIN